MATYEKEKWRNVYYDIERYPDKRRGNAPGFVVTQLKKYITEGLRLSCEDSRISKIFNDLDVNHKNWVTCDVFVKEMSKKERRSAFAEEFKRRDYNRDGSLSIDEVKDAFKRLEVKEEDIEKYFKEVDTDHNNRISEKEFMKMV